MKKKGNLAYAIFLFAYVFVVLAVAGVLLSRLWRFAEEYEISRPNKTMDAYVQELNTNLWNDQVAQTITEMPHSVQSDEDCAAAVQELLSGGITYVRAASGGSTDTINYSLRCGKNIIGKVKLVQDTSKAEEMQFDMLPWVVGEAEFDFNGLYTSIQVTVPKNYSVTLNGVMLGSEYVIEDDIHFSLLEEYYASYPNLPVMVTYYYDQILGELTPVIYDDNGNEVQIDENAGEEQFLNNCSEAELTRLTEFTENFAERYQSYNSGVNGDAAAAYNRLASYIVTGSDLDTRMKMVQEGLEYTHVSSLTMNYTTLNSAVSFGGGVYLCDYTTSFTTKGANGTQEFINNVKITVIDKNGDLSDLRVASLDLYKNSEELS